MEFIEIKEIGREERMKEREKGRDRDRDREIERDGEKGGRDLPASSEEGEEVSGVGGPCIFTFAPAYSQGPAGHMRGVTVAGSQGALDTNSLYTGFWGFKPRSSCLHSQHSYL